jgi:hypothetical protein
VVLGFIIDIHTKDITLLERIKSFFDNVGIISPYGQKITYFLFSIRKYIRILKKSIRWAKTAGDPHNK